MPTQIIGLTSTPPTGGTALLVGFKSGSVGKYAIIHGNFVIGTDGYHVITILTMNKISEIANNGPRTFAISFAVVGSKASAFVEANAAKLVEHVSARVPNITKFFLCCCSNISLSLLLLLLLLLFFFFFSSTHV